MLRWLDRPWGRGLPTTIGVSLATTLTMAGVAVAGQAGHGPAAASSQTKPVTATFPAPHTMPPAARPEPNSRPSVYTPTYPPTRPVRIVVPVPAAPVLAGTPDPGAAWSVTGPLPPVTHPQDDRLGSTVCSHEHCNPPSAAALAGLAAVRSDRQQPASTTDPAQPTASSTTPTDPAPTDPAPTDPAPTGGGSAQGPTATGTPTVPPAPTHVAPPASAPPSSPAGHPTRPPTRPPAPVVRPPSVAPAPPVPAEGGPSPQGVDVSSYQGSVDWLAAIHRGARFAYVKATESTGYTNPSFTQQYNGSQRAGLVRGAYHFALPDRSDGATQALYFITHGGGWSPDGSTLPPMLDIEYNPYGATCYGLSGPQMTRWVSDFSAAVHSRTGRFPIMYSTRDWWSSCTTSPNISARNPLFVACYCPDPGALPNGWRYQTIWQYNDNGPLPGDQDLFNGSYADLRRFALGI